MTKKNGVVCKKKGRKKGGRLTGGNMFDDWISSIINELGEVGRAIGNFVNNNMDLFTTILVDLVVCLVFPEFGLLEFTGSIIAISSTIAKYSSPNPNSPSVTDADAKAALNSLMADDRWDTHFIQPVMTYMGYILDYTTASTPAPVRSYLGGDEMLMTFDLHGLPKELPNGDIVIESVDYDIALSQPIVFKPDIQGGNWTMTITGADGDNRNRWVSGNSREQAIATLVADPAGFCSFCNDVSSFGGDYAWKYPACSSLADALMRNEPYPPPFQMNNSKDIYPTIIKIMSQKTFPV